jgi:hypothetical protein
MIAEGTRIWYRQLWEPRVGSARELREWRNGSRVMRTPVRKAIAAQLQLPRPRTGFRYGPALAPFGAGD